MFFLKKTVKLLCIAGLFFFVAVAFNYAWIALKNDLSLRKVVNLTSYNKPANQELPPVYLVSFAHGPEYYVQNQNAMAASALNKGVDFIFNYRAAHLDPVFYEQHKDFFAKHGANGLWIWKPYLIDKVLKEIPEGAYLVYLDANFIFKKPIIDLLAALKTQDMIFIQALGKLQRLVEYVKMDVLQALEIDLYQHQDSPVLASGCLILKNNHRTRSFINEWYKLCQNLSFLDNSSSKAKSHPDFKHHFHEGALLSALNYARKPNAKVLTMKEFYNYFYWAHRKKSYRSALKSFYTLYGVQETLFYSLRPSGSALTSVSLLNFPPLVRVRRWFYEVMGW
ncbi:MAG: hypothetical protein CMM87_03630 [Rickettsiales bacterium]|nr:hypothetical protein [Rickettsiales bacterium]|tara:strand:+ start:17950 stop:18960 length:1011 start_codon:yes stop_codon:yes gene_type:complete